MQNGANGPGAALVAVGQDVLVGAPGDSGGRLPTGAAYLLDGGTGQITLALPSPHPTPGDRYGVSVAALGTRLVIGAPGANRIGEAALPGAGAVYLLDGTTGDLIRTFRSPEAAPGSQFGASVAVVDGDLLIGAPLDSLAGPDSGAVYRFDGVTGELIRTIVSPNPARRDRFGVSIAAVGSDILVGTPGDDARGRNAGAAYLFDGATGELLQEFRNPNEMTRSGFAVSVSAIGEDILVGAPGDDSAGTDTGAVYRFDAGTGGHLQTYRAPNPAGNEKFGLSFAAVGDKVVIGAPGNGEQAPGGGAFYRFE
jgi:hypothetical protein